MAATRILSDKEKRALDLAYQRRTPTDIANTQYAQSRGLWSPSTQLPQQLTPLPMQAGEREAMINRYVQTQPQMGIEGATRRVDELFAGRPPAPTGQTVPPSLTFAPTGQQVSTAPPSGDRSLDIAGMGGQPAPQTQQADIGSSYQKAMTDLLRQYQSKTGGTDEDLQKQRAALIQARFGAQTDLTPEQLRVLSPEAQRALRGQDVKGIEEQLGGVSGAMKSRATERSELRTVMEKAQDRLADIEKEERGRSFERGKEERGYAFEREKLSSRQTLEREKLESQLLSPTEAKSLGVPYGTTKIEASASGIISQIAGTAGTGRAGGGGGGVAGRLSPRAQAVYDNPTLLSNYTPTEKGKILNEITSNRLDTTRFSVPALNATQREQIALFDEIESEALRAAESYRKGIDTGPIASRVSKVGATLGFAPEFTDLRSTIDNLGSILLRMRSGAAVTPQEFERIRGFIPQLNEDETTASRKVNRFFDEIAKAKGNYITRATQTSFQIQQNLQTGFGGQSTQGETYISPKKRTYTLPNPNQ